jgi:hypothetical protein
MESEGTHLRNVRFFEHKLLSAVHCDRHISASSGPFDKSGRVLTSESRSYVAEMDIAPIHLLLVAACSLDLLCRDELQLYSLCVRVALTR